MDFFSLLFSVFDFLKLLIPLVLICFVLHKFFNPIKENFIKNKEYGWIRAVLIINFFVFFVPIFLTYLYFYFTGIIQAQAIDPELMTTFFEHIMFILTDLIRVIIASIILAIALLGFEMLCGIINDLLKNKNYSETIKELISITITCAVFLLLILFVFNWVLMGLFIYIFFGGISTLPLMFFIIP